MRNIDSQPQSENIIFNVVYLNLRENERTIKNGQSRDTANIEQRQTKLKKHRKLLKKSNTKSRCSRRVSSSGFI